MQRFSFKKGLIFVELNTRWQLIKRLVTGNLQFESEQGEIRNLTDKEVLQLWNTGKWLIDKTTLGLNTDIIYLVTPADLSTYPLKWQEIAKRRLHYINAINPSVNKYNVQLWQSLIQTATSEISDTKPPCPSSVQAWWKRYRNTKSISCLLPSTKNAISRKDDARYAVFEDVIKTVYLNTQKLPVSDVFSRINQRITILNMGRDCDHKIKHVSRSTIYVWVANLRADIKDASRLGAEVARNKYRFVMGGLKVRQVLERIELDHTPLDAILRDETTNLTLGKAILTVAVDKYSRIVTGYYISFNAPSSYAVLQCLKQTIRPKDELLKRFPDIKNQWPVFGIPDLLATDNGMDLHAEALKKTCLELGIQILYCPAKAPEMKGSIERFNKTLNGGLIHKLPGTTFSNINERGDYPSEDLAAIDMETLVHLVTKWIVDVYNVTPQRDIGDTPLNKWIESARHRVTELPVYPTQLDVMTGVPARRTIFHYGIELEGLHYNNRQLQELRKISGENMQIDLKFYENQVAYIDVFDPYAKEYLRVNAVDEEYSKDLLRETHRLARVEALKKFGEQYSKPQLTEAKLDIDMKIKESIKSKKMGTRKQAANLLMHDSAAIFQSRNPLEDAHKAPLKPRIIKAPEPLDSGLDDDLPDVSAHTNDKKSKGDAP